MHAHFIPRHTSNLLHKSDSKKVTCNNLPQIVSRNDERRKKLQQLYHKLSVTKCMKTERAEQRRGKKISMCLRPVSKLFDKSC
jgi:hypothetical protein